MLKTTFQWTVNQNTKIFIRENAFQMPYIKQQPCCLASMCLWTMIMFESLLIFLFRGNHIWMFPHDMSYDMVIAEQHSIFSSFCCRGNHIWIFPHDILRLVVVVEQSLNICFSFFCREAVESCENWSQSTTQQVDLAFNIFFMIYFFIRVSTYLIILGKTLQFVIVHFFLICWVLWMKGS